MLIILALFFIAIIFGLAILLAGGIVFSQAQAKKEARKILANGRVENTRKFKRVMGILAHTPNDLEAADLWKRLSELS